VGRTIGWWSLLLNIPDKRNDFRYHYVPHIKVKTPILLMVHMREMNIWIKEADKVIIVAPRSDVERTVIDLEYGHQNIEFVTIPSFDLLSLKLFFCQYKKPQISWCIYTTLKGLIISICVVRVILDFGAIIQIAFPINQNCKYAK
jgi:hypothetical protein